MDLHTKAVQEIIKAQQVVIGPIAIEQAKNISGLRFSSLSELQISGNAKDVLSSLVSRYSEFFGQASVEVCKDAVREIKPPIPSDELPENLQ